MARKIVITSGKGGVGKTTITANLGVMLSAMGLRVVLIDIDFGLNNLDVVMGVENKVLYDMFDVIDGRCRTRQALISVGEKKNLYVLPSGGARNYYNVSGQSVKLLIDNIEPLFDYVLIDCPAGIDLGFHRAVSCADEAIVVTTPNLTSLRDADKVTSILKSYKLNSVGLIVNKARGDLMVSEKMMLPNDIVGLLKTELIGVVPESDIVLLSSGVSMPKNSDVYKAFKILSQNIHKGCRKIYDVTKKYSGVIGSIRRGLKRSV